MPRPSENFVLYDGECPVCSNFVAWTNLRLVRPDIKLIDARTAPELVSAYRAEGVEINDNMVIRLGEMTMHGADAFGALARIGQPNSVALRGLMRWLSKPNVSRPLYPLMAAGRRTLLFLLRRSLI